MITDPPHTTALRAAQAPGPGASSTDVGEVAAYEPKFDGFVRHEVYVIEGGGRPLRRIVAAVWRSWGQPCDVRSHAVSGHAVWRSVTRT